MTSAGLLRLTCMTYETVTSADGTSIAYERFGGGPLLITVCGATCDRALMRPMAQALGEHFTAVDHDRRGRGDSGDTLPYAVDREIEDIAALIDRVGGPAHLYGHSSGAGLVLHAVAAGLPVDEFVLHDPPYSPDDDSSREEARRYGQRISDLLARANQGRRVALCTADCCNRGVQALVEPIALGGCGEQPACPFVWRRCSGTQPLGGPHHFDALEKRFRPGPGAVFGFRQNRPERETEAHMVLTAVP